MFFSGARPVDFVVSLEGREFCREDLKGENEGTKDRSGKETIEKRPQGCTLTPERSGVNQRMELMRKGAERRGGHALSLLSSGLWIDCFLSDLEVKVGRDGECGHHQGRDWTFRC